MVSHAPAATDTETGYAHPEVLVSTAWVAEHLDDPAVRIVESDEDILLYDIGHIPGAIKLDWHLDLQDQVRREFVDRAGFEALMGRVGIANDSTVVFYGDKNNWYACYTFWLFAYFGHERIKVMDGGRAKWEAEGRPYTREVAAHAPTTYVASDPDPSIRAFRDDVLAQVASGHPALVDVRSPQEFSGEVIHMPGYPQEGAQRGGHVTGAASIPWGQAVAPDGTFKPVEELRALYGDKGVTPDKDVITYCRIGERSSHSWFVLTYLLGYPNVRNYDGSWTEYGSLVNVPIETGA
ncbi:MAG: sulfurtransferase [Chloroflexota bacterium]|nr:sulfurtransferase [Chloroflexota bacterium]